MSKSYTSLLKSWIAEHYTIEVLKTSVEPSEENQGLQYKASVSVVGLAPHLATRASPRLAVNAASRSLLAFLVVAQRDNPEQVLARQSKNYLAIAEPGIDVDASDFERWESVLEEQFAGDSGWIVVAAKTYSSYMSVGVYRRGEFFTEFSGLDSESITFVFDYLPSHYFVCPNNAKELLDCDSDQPWHDPDKLPDELHRYVTPAGEMVGPRRMGRYVSHLRRLETKRRIFPGDLATDLTWSPKIMTPTERSRASPAERRQDTCLQIMYAYKSSGAPEVIVAQGDGSKLLVEDLARMNIPAKHVTFVRVGLESSTSESVARVADYQEAAQYVEDHDRAIFCHRLESTNTVVLMVATMFAQQDSVVRTY